MTLTKAAVVLGLAPSTLRNQIHNGKLKAKKLGRDWHVSASEVEQYRQVHLRRSRQNAAQAAMEDGR